MEAKKGRPARRENAAGPSALEAIGMAQCIAFAPMLFQVALSLRNMGLLAYLDRCGDDGATLTDIVAQTDASHYAAALLLDMGASGGIVSRMPADRGPPRFTISPVGHFLLHDEMTRVNMDFTQDVCYQGLFHLQESLETGHPAGLKVFGDWPTIYPALSQLPDQARRSWFAFDHFYSDAAFDAALPHVFSLHPARLYDVGGNTGKWAKRCCQYDENVAVTILDLPQQIDVAKKEMELAGLVSRVDFHPLDLLEDPTLPMDADVWWMSQFLDCFSPEQVVSILRKVAQAMRPASRLCILECFWDAQRFDASEFSLNATSLYFACMANGNSRFYGASEFYSFIEQAGLVLEKQVDDLGLSHTLLICGRA